MSFWLPSVACRQDMHDQPRYKPLAQSAFFGDERSARPMVEGTVARGHLDDDPVLATGRDGKDFTDRLPVAVDEALLRRGQERFGIYCTPCHGALGLGDGMVVRRGYRRPPSFHIDRLREAKVGYLFDVMTSGFGAMPDYAAQVSARDRWAIAAYIRVLQLSQDVKAADLTPEDRRAVEQAPKVAMPGAQPAEREAEKR